MQLLYQNSYVTQISRAVDELLAESLFLSSDYEIKAIMRVDISSFRIKEARLDIYRSPGNKENGGKELPQILGFEAYFREGKRLLKILDQEGGNKIPRELFKECINGLIQAETYLLEERGFSSTRAYESSFGETYRNGCIYHACPERTTYSWFEYLGHTERQGNLFNRLKTCVVYRSPESLIEARGFFNDSFHELGLAMRLSEDGLITEINGNFIRTRDPVCVDTEKRLGVLQGKRATTISHKEIVDLIGGPGGCMHFTDMVNNVCQAVVRARETNSFPLKFQF